MLESGANISQHLQSPAGVAYVRPVGVLEREAVQCAIDVLREERKHRLRELLPEVLGRYAGRLLRTRDQRTI